VKAELRTLVVIVVAGFSALVAGLALLMYFVPPDEVSGLIPTGFMGILASALAYGGLLLILVAILVRQRLETGEIIGPHSAENLGERPVSHIMWMLNQRYASVVRRNVIINQGFIVTAVSFFGSSVLFVVSSLGVLPVISPIGDVIALTWSALLVLFVLLFGLWLGSRSANIPRRVGLSSAGIHIEYPPDVRPSKRAPWASPFVAWNLVAAMEPISGSTSVNGVNMNLKGGGRRSIVDVSPDIVERIIEEWDKGVPLRTLSDQ
jgi:hypothetical protein